MQNDIVVPDEISLQDVGRLHEKALQEVADYALDQLAAEDDSEDTGNSDNDTDDNENDNDDANNDNISNGATDNANDNGNNDNATDNDEIDNADADDNDSNDDATGKDETENDEVDNDNVGYVHLGNPRGYHHNFINTPGVYGPAGGQLHHAGHPSAYPHQNSRIFPPRYNPYYQSRLWGLLQPTFSRWGQGLRNGPSPFGGNFRRYLSRPGYGSRRTYRSRRRYRGRRRYGGRRSYGSRRRRYRG